MNLANMIKDRKKYVNVKKTVLKWIGSYFAVLLLVFTVFFAIYYNVENILNKKLSQYSAEWIHNKKEIVEQMFRVFYNSTLDLSMDERILGTAVYNEHSLDQNRYELVDLRKRLSSYSLMDERMASLFVFFPNSDYFVSATYVGSSQNFYTVYFSRTGVSYEQWLALIKGTHFNELIPLPHGNADKSPKSYLYLKPVLSASRQKLTAVIGIEILPSAFLFDEFDTSGNNRFFIFDDQNQLIFSTVDDINAYQVVTDALDDEPDFTEKRFKEHVLFQSLSTELPLKYLYLTDANEFLSDLNNSRVMMFFGTTIVLLVGFLLIVYIANRNYLPIKHLNDYIFNTLKLRPSESRNVNELYKIRDAVETTAQENAALIKRNEANEAFLRNAKIADFLKSGRRIEDISDIFLSPAINFKRGFYMVMLYVFDDLSEIFFEKEQSDSAENYAVAKLIVSSILNEMLLPVCASVNIETDGLLYIILNANSAGDTERIYEIIEDAQDFILKNFNFCISVILSDMHEGTYGLPNCYAETLSCIEFLHDEKARILRYNDLKSAKKAPYYYPLEKEAKLLNYLRTGNRNMCAELLNDIFEQNEAIRSLSPNTAKRLSYDLLGTLSKLEIISIDEIEIEVLSSLRKLPNSAEMKDTLLKVFDDICITQDNSSATSFDIVEKSKAYIAQYSNISTLSLEQIAQSIPTNPSYLSYLFKKMTGTGILEYITQLRMEEAKRLLITTNISLEELCVAVGYSSVRGFSRAFAKYAGVTPGKYRLLYFNPEDK